MTEYNGQQYEARPETSEFSCEGCDFIHLVKKVSNVGLKTRPEYKEVYTGQKGCAAPNIEPFRSCKHDHMIYERITKV